MLKHNKWLKRRKDVVGAWHGRQRVAHTCTCPIKVPSRVLTSQASSHTPYGRMALTACLALYVHGLPYNLGIHPLPHDFLLGWLNTCSMAHSLLFYMHNLINNLFDTRPMLNNTTSLSRFPVDSKVYIQLPKIITKSPLIKL